MKNNKQESITQLTQTYQELLTSIGEDLTREGLQNTPERAANAFYHLTQGYSSDLDEIVNNALFSCKSNEMVVVKNIELFSICEHHMLPIIGKCHVGYIPNGKILGLSKIARIIDMFARRLQIQENLNREIAEAILKVTNAQGIGVIIDATHLCIMARGVEKQHAVVKTSSMLGTFKDNPKIRDEFLALLRHDDENSINA
jgi:GTP cyclohydrolase I